MGRRIEYMIGDLIGPCTYLEDRPTKNNRRALFKCSCGNEFETQISDVRRGTTKSCGCTKGKMISEANMKHGLGYHRIYYTWKNMVNRCLDENYPNYKNYGGRGITVCDEWKENPKAFYDHVTSLPNYGKEGYTLDREKNDGGYYPGNLRWETKHIQSVNRGMSSRNKSGYIGVHPFGKRWYSSITVNYKLTHIGSFPTTTEAVQARNQYIMDNSLTEYKIQDI